MPIYEHELLGFFFDPLGTEKVELTRQLGAGPATNLRQALAEVLLDADDASRLLVESAVVSVNQPTSFKSILLKRGDAGDAQKIIAFNFTDAFKETALPFLGILIAVFASSAALGSAIPALGIVKTLWQKLVILRAPEDADAICLLDALGHAGSANRADHKTIPPTWEQLLATSELDPKQGSLALKLLRSKGIIEIESWGGQDEDIDNLANRWKVRF